MATDLTVANTIWQQLTAGRTNTIKVMSWGVDLKKRVADTNWLRFPVNGMKFKGLVKVIYNVGMDVYEVEFWKRTKKKNEFGGFDTDYVLEKKMDMVYFDELTEKIDEVVEKIGAYSF